MGRVRVVALVAAVSGLLVLSSGAQVWADTTVNARLHPQNGSGVSGSVTLTATDDGALVVDMRAHGMVPGPHAQHIHGSQEGGHFMCASMADDTNGDGVLTNEEGTGEYGTIFLALTTRGDTSADSGLAVDRMPVADESGDLSYHRTIPADALPDGLLDQLARVHVVQHGIDVNDNGKYDLQALGESTFAKSLGLPAYPRRPPIRPPAGWSWAPAWRQRHKAASRPAAGRRTTLRCPPSCRGDWALRCSPRR